MEGRAVRWHDWSLLIGFNAREAITLHDIKFAGRPVCYRASLAEMVVPYGSPETPHYRKNVFDIGEYGLGKLANSLTLGCDCLGAIQYLDCWISDINGDPMCIANGICIHEEDYGILWKHWDFRTDRTEVRRARRLVISSISTVGNYEYGSYWYFYLDGTFEFEMKATGIINTVACVPGRPTSTAPRWRRAWSARSTSTCSARASTWRSTATRTRSSSATRSREPEGPANPYGNAFYLAGDPARDRVRAAPATPTASATGSSSIPTGPTTSAGRPATSWSRRTAAAVFIRPGLAVRPAHAASSATICG